MSTKTKGLLLVVVSIVVFVIFIAVYLYFFVFQPVRQKAVESSAVSDFRQVRVIAEKYRVQRGDYEGFCNSSSFRARASAIMEIQPAGILVRDDRTIKCYDSADKYATSMSVFYSLVEGTHVCIDNNTGIFVLRNSHISSVSCDE